MLNEIKNKIGIKPYYLTPFPKILSFIDPYYVLWVQKIKMLCNHHNFQYIKNRIAT